MSGTYVRRAELVWRRVGDDVLIRTLDGRLATLRGTGGLLWAELDDPVSFEALAGRLQRRFPDSAKRIEVDVRAALDALVDDGLVVRR